MPRLTTRTPKPPRAEAAASPAAADTGRPAYQKFDVVNHRSAIDGFGAFANEPIPPHRKIGEIRGERITVAEGRRRAATMARIMMVEISHRHAVDASKSTDPMRYTNHSCQANARMQIRDGRIEFYAIKPIAQGEEITVDYGETHHGGTLKCRCGQPGCIGFL